MKPEPNITRLDYARSHGWWVRFQRGYDGGKRKTISKMFSDGVYGGKDAALKEAKAWRDMVRPALPMRERLVKAPPGYGYIRRVILGRRRSVSECFVCWLRIEEGRCKQTSVSTTRWGVGVAKKRAEAWLRKERRELRKRLG